MEGSVSHVSPMMQLLRQSYDRGDATDDLHQKVYRNFTLVHNVIIALLESIARKFPDDLSPDNGQMRGDIGIYITFCRCQLNYMVMNLMVNKDEARTKSSVLLEKIERHLFEIIKGLTDYLSGDEVNSFIIKKLRSDHFQPSVTSEVENLYVDAIRAYGASLMPGNLLILNDNILEFLDQVNEDLHHLGTDAARIEERATMSECALLLRYYLELTADRINDEEMNDFLVSSQLVASNMAYYAFHSRHIDLDSLDKEKMESDIHIICLWTTSVLPQHVSSSIPAMNHEVMTSYVRCVQDNLSYLLKSKNFTDIMTEQFTILQSGLWFVVLMLADSGPVSAGHEKLSDIMVQFQALVRNVGSLVSCLHESQKKGSRTSTLSDSIITPTLSDFIDKVNLMKEESIEIMEGSATEVCGKMHLLHQCGNCVKTSDDIHQMLKYVYRNFTSIHNATIALLENLRRKFHEGSDLPPAYRLMRESMGSHITFCRWQLNCMFNKDGGINEILASLLKKIESRFLLLVKELTDYLSREVLNPSRINDLRGEHIDILFTEIESVCEDAISTNKASVMPSYMLIADEYILEFINQVLEDLNYEDTTSKTTKERKTMRRYVVLLRFYFEFIVDRINGEESNHIMVSSQQVASNMAYYSFLIRYASSMSWNRKSADIRLGCLRITSVLPQHVSSSIPAMNDELLTIYVKCIQDSLSHLLKGEGFTDPTSQMSEQFTVLLSGLWFLLILLADSGPYSAGQEKLSDIRVRFQALLRSVGSLIVSCFNNETNGSITPTLSDFIDNVNLMKEESIAIIEGSATKVRGKMHLLHRCGGRVKTSDDVHQMLKYVYRNFTSIHNATIALLKNLQGKFHQGSDLSEYRLMRGSMGSYITFCRWQLNCMFNKDGEKNEISALLLKKIESRFLLLIEGLTDYLSQEVPDHSRLNDLRVEQIDTLLTEIEPVYEATVSRDNVSFMPSYMLIADEFILEFINQVHEDLNYEDTTSKTAEVRKTMSGYMVLLRFYFKFLADRIIGEEMNGFLISSQLVASKMAYYSFLSRCTYSTSWNTESAIIRMESDIRLGCLRTTLVLPQHVSSSIPAMDDELLSIYVSCIQDNLSDLLKTESFTDLASYVQFMIIQWSLSSLRILPADSWPPSATHEEKQSDARLRFQDLVKKIGSLIISCFNGEIQASTTSSPSDFIANVDLIKEEIIEIMYCIVLGIREQEYLRTHQLPFLIILLKDLEQIIDSKSELIMNFKSDAVDRNLVLFKSYIQNIKGNSTTHGGSKMVDELDFCEKDKPTKMLANKMQVLRNYLLSDIDQINVEEMSESLIFAQVSTFDMACHHLFRRYGEVYWWKVYVQTKDHVDSHMRVGALRAAVLSLEGSSTHPLSAELLMGYVNCIQDNITELVKNEASDKTRDQFMRLHQELSFPALFIKHCVDQEKRSEFKLRFQTLLRGIGPIILSCFNNLSSNLVTNQSVWVDNLVKKLNSLWEEFQSFQYTVILHRVRQESPKVLLPGFFDLLLDNWKDFMHCKSDTEVITLEQCQAIHEILVVFKSFIQKSRTSPVDDEESKNLCTAIVEAGYVAEYLLNSFSVEAFPVSCTSCWLPEFMEHIKLIEARIMEVNGKIANVQAPVDMVVGFKAEMELIKQRLYSGYTKLDVVSIVGMPGSGKTTLARKLYEDSSPREHFDVRAWCIVSQEYNKKELFLTILGSKLVVTDIIRRMSEADLFLMVHQMLYNRRYFIVLDDIWGIEAFNELKRSFPDNNNKSRIMLTSRKSEIGLQAKHHSDPMELGHLSDEESWDLLQQKAYPQRKCPTRLCQLGKKIAQKCKGLPLAVVVVAGFLAKSAEKDELWEQVAENLSSSYRDLDSQAHWMGLLELSYKFLPDFLKPLFLYLGAFPEDKEIPADNLIWLWIADGLVQKTGNMNLEIQARESLMELIDRNLVMVARRSSDGRVKGCHVHDLLRDMCLVKAKEENFMDQTHAYQKLPEYVMYQQRLSVLLKRDAPASLKPLNPYRYFPVVPVSPPLRTLLFFDMNDPDVRDHNPDFSSLKLSRVIHSESTKSNVDDVIKLLHLRYISVRVECNNIPDTLSNLQNLETLIIRAVRGEIVLPSTIWEMVKLRHLHVDDSATFMDASENSPKLENLRTLSTPVIGSRNANKFFSKVPNVQKLRCILKNEHVDSDKDINECHDLTSLDKLESLTASYQGSVKSPGQFKLPMSLTKLSLSGFCLQWSQVSIFQKLPKLEVLKLRSAAVQDGSWNTGDDVFPELKVLKLENLDIQTWIASEENFPCLEKLVLERCEQLVEIHSSLEENNCLERIEVISCSQSAEIWAKKIAGNNFLSVHIHHLQLDSDQPSSICK